MANLNDNVVLCAYLYVQDAYNRSKNLFDGFTVLIESVLAKYSVKDVKFLALHQDINDAFHLKMPKATLINLLERLERKKVIFRPRGKNYIQIQVDMLQGQFQENTDKQMELSELFLGFRQALLDQGKEIPIETIKRQVCAFIYAHCSDFAAFIDRGVRPQLEPEEDETLAIQLCDFLLDCRHCNQPYYQSFLRLYNGAVQTSLLNLGLDKVQELQGRRMNIDQVILDTNFLMRVLDIQAEWDGQMALETLNMLQTQGIKAVALSQTLEEIGSSIRFFLKEEEPYTHHTSVYYRNQTMRMGGLLSARQRGITRTELLDLSTYDTLFRVLTKNHHIEIIEDEDRYDEKIKADKVTINDLISFKNSSSYGERPAIHDLRLIHFCRGNRPKRVGKFSEARVWVLTNDIKLTYWNQKNSDTVQECITEGQLANLMWLQSPDKDNNGLESTIITLSIKNALDLSHIKEFARNAQEFQEKNTKRAEELDKISLVYAGDSITTEDVQRVVCKEQTFDQLVNSKASKIREHQTETEQVLRETGERNIMLQSENECLEYELKISKFATEIAEAEKEKKLLEDQVKELDEKQKAADHVRSVGRTKGRQLGAALLLLFVVFFCLSVWLFYKRQWLQDGLGKILSSAVVSAVLMVLLYLISASLTGGIKSPEGCFNFFKKDLMQKELQKRGLSEEFLPGELKKMNDLEDFLASKCSEYQDETERKQQEWEKVQEKLQNLRSKKAGLEAALEEKTRRPL